MSHIDNNSGSLHRKSINASTASNNQSPYQASNMPEVEFDTEAYERSEMSNNKFVHIIQQLFIALINTPLYVVVHYAIDPFFEQQDHVLQGVTDEQCFTNTVTKLKNAQQSQQMLLPNAFTRKNLLLENFRTQIVTILFQHMFGPAVTMSVNKTESSTQIIFKNKLKCHIDATDTIFDFLEKISLRDTARLRIKAYKEWNSPNLNKRHKTFNDAYQKQLNVVNLLPNVIKPFDLCDLHTGPPYVHFTTAHGPTYPHSANRHMKIIRNNKQNTANSQSSHAMTNEDDSKMSDIVTRDEDNQDQQNNENDTIDQTDQTQIDQPDQANVNTATNTVNLHNVSVAHSSDMNNTSTVSSLQQGNSNAIYANLSKALRPPFELLRPTEYTVTKIISYVVNVLIVFNLEITQQINTIPTVQNLSEYNRVKETLHDYAICTMYALVNKATSTQRRYRYFRYAKWLFIQFNISFDFANNLIAKVFQQHNFFPFHKEDRLPPLDITQSDLIDFEETKAQSTTELANVQSCHAIPIVQSLNTPSSTMSIASNARSTALIKPKSTSNKFGVSSPMLSARVTNQFPQTVQTSGTNSIVHSGLRFKFPTKQFPAKSERILAERFDLAQSNSNKTKTTKGSTNGSNDRMSSATPKQKLEFSPNNKENSMVAHSHVSSNHSIHTSSSSHTAQSHASMQGVNASGIAASDISQHTHSSRRSLNKQQDLRVQQLEQQVRQLMDQVLVLNKEKQKSVIPIQQHNLHNLTIDHDVNVIHQASQNVAIDSVSGTHSQGHVQQQIVQQPQQVQQQTVQQQQLYSQQIISNPPISQRGTINVNDLNNLNRVNSHVQQSLFGFRPHAVPTQHNPHYSNQYGMTNYTNYNTFEHSRYNSNNTNNNHPNGGDNNNTNPSDFNPYAQRLPQRSNNSNGNDGNGGQNPHNHSGNNGFQQGQPTQRLNIKTNSIDDYADKERIKAFVQAETRDDIKEIRANLTAVFYGHSTAPNASEQEMQRVSNEAIKFIVSVMIWYVMFVRPTANSYNPKIAARSEKIALRHVAQQLKGDARNQYILYCNELRVKINNMTQFIMYLLRTYIEHKNLPKLRETIITEMPPDSTLKRRTSTAFKQNKLTAGIWNHLMDIARSENYIVSDTHYNQYIINSDDLFCSIYAFLDKKGLINKMEYALNSHPKHIKQPENLTDLEQALTLYDSHQAARANVKSRVDAKKYNLSQRTAGSDPTATVAGKGAQINYSQNPYGRGYRGRKRGKYPYPRKPGRGRGNPNNSRNNNNNKNKQQYNPNYRGNNKNYPKSRGGYNPRYNKNNNRANRGRGKGRGRARKRGKGKNKQNNARGNQYSQGYATQQSNEQSGINVPSAPSKPKEEQSYAAVANRAAKAQVNTANLPPKQSNKHQKKKKRGNNKGKPRFRKKQQNQQYATHCRIVDNSDFDIASSDDTDCKSFSFDGPEPAYFAYTAVLPHKQH